MSSPFPPPTPQTAATEPAATEPAASPNPKARSRRTLVAGAVAVVAVAAVAVVAVVMVGGGDDGDSAGDTTIVFDERWRVRVDGLGDEASRADLVWHDDDVALFVRDADDAGQGLVLAIDPATGDELWSEEVDSALARPTVSRVGDLVLIQSASSDGVGLYEVVAIDVASGRTEWTERHSGQVVLPVGDVVVMNRTFAPDEDVIADVVVVDAATGDEIAARTPDEGAVRLAALRDDGMVVMERAGEQWRAVGLGLDGEERWTRDVEFGVSLVFDLAPGSSEDVVVIADGDEVVGLDLASGDERWSSRIGEDDSVTVDVETGVVVACTPYEDGEAPEVGLTAFDLGGGDELWSSTLDGAEPSFAGFSGTNVLTLEGGVGQCQSFLPFLVGDRVAAVDARSGEVVWQLGGADGFVEASPSSVPGGGVITRWPRVRDVDTVGVVSGEEGRRTQSLHDAVTGEAIVSDVDVEDGVTRLVLAGDTVVVTRFAEGTFTVADVADESTEVAYDETAFVSGDADGTLYVVVGSEIVALD